MNDIQTILRILEILIEHMDDDGPIDPAFVSAETLGISISRWKRLMVMMIDNGLIDGEWATGEDPSKLCHEITLKGLEYFQEKRYGSSVQPIEIPLMCGDRLLEKIKLNLI